jgi:hypothetical protein
MIDAKRAQLSEHVDQRIPSQPEAQMNGLAIPLGLAARSM